MICEAISVGVDFGNIDVLFCTSIGKYMINLYMSKRHMLEITLVRGFCDVTKASRKAKLKDIFASLPVLVMSHHFISSLKQ